MTINQCCKALDRAGVKYSIVSKNSIILRDFDNAPCLCIENIKDKLVLNLFSIPESNMFNANFKFNNLTHDEENLYFSYKGESPLTVSIK